MLSSPFCRQRVELKRWCIICYFVRWVFVPLWVFHGIVSRGRFSMPAPTPPRDRHVRVASFVISKSFFWCRVRVSCLLTDVRLCWFDLSLLFRKRMVDMFSPDQVMKVVCLTHHNLQRGHWTSVLWRHFLKTWNDLTNDPSCGAVVSMSHSSCHSTDYCFWAATLLLSRYTRR